MAGRQTDAEVIRESVESPARFEEIFNRHAANVHRYLRRRLDERLAEELTSETFTQAFRVRRRFDASQGSAAPWLYGIAVNLVKMHLRTEQRRERAYRLLREPGSQPPSTGESDDRLDARALWPTLTAALARLSADQREVLLLHAWSDLSHAEIAAVLAIPTEVVRKRLHRARTRVARELERYDAEIVGRPVARPNLRAGAA